MPNTPRATAEIQHDAAGIHVIVGWDVPVDRNRQTSWLLSARDHVLAERLKRAVDAQVVMLDPEIRTDTGGKTYVAAHSAILARHMNADLRRLGF